MSETFRCGWAFASEYGQPNTCSLPSARRDTSHWCEYHDECAQRGNYTAGPAPSPEPTKATNPKDAIADCKVALSLCSPIAKAHWSAAQFCGMTKYGSWNWRITGVRVSVYLHAMQRHMDAFNSGEEFDPIDGTRHLGNIMACCAILLDAAAAGKLTDDRPPSVDIRATYAEVEANNRTLKDKYADKNPRHCTIDDTVTKTDKE